MKNVIVIDDTTVTIDGVRFVKEKPKHINGKWYIAECNGKKDYLIRFNKIDECGKICAYEFTFDGADQFCTGGCFDKISRPATKDEIEKNLIAEAERKGFKEGICFRPLSSYKRIAKGYFNYIPAYMIGEDCLCIGDDVIWRSSKGWATVLPPKKQLPKSKGEFAEFLMTYGAKPSYFGIGDFLSDYED